MEITFFARLTERTRPETAKNRFSFPLKSPYFFCYKWVMRGLGGGVLAFTFLLGGCYLPQVTLKHAPGAAEKMRVAVLPFRDAPEFPGSGEAAAEAMIGDLLRVPAYEVIERSAMQQIIKEQSLGVTGAISPETAAAIGKLLGADAIVIGSINEYQNRRFLIFPPAKVTVNARMVRTATGTIDWAGSHTSGWPPAKWATSFFWPLGVFWAVTSPSEQNRLEKASRGIASSVASKIAHSR